MEASYLTGYMRLGGTLVHMTYLYAAYASMYVCGGQVHCHMPPRSLLMRHTRKLFFAILLVMMVEVVRLFSGRYTKRNTLLVYLSSICTFDDN